ncbi:MAG: CPBP family intramembrane glutamic endopeptidase [Sphingomonadales bacterium]
MEKALVSAAVIVIPTILLVIGFRLSGRKVEWRPLLWAGFATLVYFLLLRSRGVIPEPGFMAGLELNFFGKALSIAGTLAMLAFLPRVSFGAAGFTWKQNKGWLRPVIITGAMVLLFTTGGAFLAPASSVNTSLEWLSFQATLPGIDEELFFRGLLLLLFHQAFGKGLRIWGADTGWGFWLVVAIFGLLHGVTVTGGELAVNAWVILGTGFLGFILTWMRERTGSLAVPVLFHNISNVAQAFV